jgi:hypothetical protein
MPRLSYLQPWSTTDRQSLTISLSVVTIFPYVCDMIFGWLVLRRAIRLPLAGLPNTVLKFIHGLKDAFTVLGILCQI